jgi:hypothetical protein
MNFHTKNIGVSYHVSLNDLYEIIRKLPEREQAALIVEILCCEDEKVNKTVANWFKENARYLISDTDAQP